MEQYQYDFIEFAIAQQAILFGEFTLKSGRISPYFFNAGRFNSGHALAKLANFYAIAIKESNIEYDVLFGPAYKGIPLVACVAYALWEKYQRESPFSFNRKELKSYGEGGNIIGAPLEGNVLIVDDVISAGTTFRETVKLLQSYPVKIAAVVTAMDRQERGASDLSATQEIEQIYQVKSINIIKLADLIQYLSAQPGMSLELERMRNYQKEYGINSELF